MSLECHERVRSHTVRVEFLHPAELRQVDDERGADDLAPGPPNELDGGLRRPARRDQVVDDQDPFTRPAGVLVHFDDGEVRITADLPKKVEWDQAKLNDITRRIAANGEDPTEYVEISYRISETKFNAWPETLKSAFAPARTLKTGKPGFRLALIQE